MANQTAPGPNATLPLLSNTFWHTILGCDSDDFKPVPKTSDRKNLKPVVDSIMERKLNHRLDPDKFIFLTQNLDCIDPEPIKQFKRYSIKIDSAQIDGLNNVDKESENKDSSPCKKAPKNPKNPDLPNLYLKLESQLVVIDRRPSLRRQNQMKPPMREKTATNEVNHKVALIESYEDCDTSEAEEIEIDCDV